MNSGEGSLSWLRLAVASRLLAGACVCVAGCGGKAGTNGPSGNDTGVATSTATSTATDTSTDDPTATWTDGTVYVPLTATATATSTSHAADAGPVDASDD